MYNFLNLEKNVGEYWKEFKTFEVSNKRREGKNFVFYDGPPFATGTPHYGHLLVGTIKDVVARYKNMCGYSVPRQWGWDCHGVPVESLVQKKLNTTRVEVVLNNTVEQFNNECRQSVLLCADQWKDTVDRMGRWVDFENSYKTMDKNYMESVWWVFKQVYDQGRVYKAKKVMPYSCKLQTTLSNHEMGDSYREVEDHYVVAKFKMLNMSDTYFLVYTTTPWTLPTNAGLCLNPKEEYSYVLDEATGETYVMAAKLVAKVMGNRKFRVKNSLTGDMFTGAKYVALFGDGGQHYHRVVTDDFVTVEDGTGVVHLSPAFGEDDYRVGQKHKLPALDYLDAEGRFQGVPDHLCGVFCKDADGTLVAELKAKSKLFKYGKVKHDYPFCDRTNTPLIYRAVDAWYLKLEDVKNRLLKNNAEIKWVPESVGSGRFANWLKDAKDWNVSRNRLWGCCLPLWVAEDGETVCVGSVEELEQVMGCGLPELHRELHKDLLDKVEFAKNGKLFKRVPEVFDCWFESGCMPYAQHHYPFENKELVESTFPADFVVEGLDQTRGWFYTLLVLGTLLFDKAPFKNVVVNGLVLAEDGAKMSKSKGNYTDPTELLNKYGADALRAYFCSSAAMYAEPLLFKEKDLQNVTRALLAPLNNALDFYRLYSDVDKWAPSSSTFVPERELDEWILAELNLLVSETNQLMEDYDLSKVLPKAAVFLDKLCNWYVRLSRKLFWEDGVSSVKNGAYNTLHYVLLNMVKLLAPFVPFMAEQMYCDLGHRGSVHWENYPKAFELSERELNLVKRMRVLRGLSTMGHNLRVKTGVKVRQPLSKMFVSGLTELSEYDKSLLKDELNLKEVLLQENQQTVTLSAKANYKVLGKRCGKDMPQVAKAVSELNTAELQTLQKQPMQVAGYQVSWEDILVSHFYESALPTESDNGLTVTLDTVLTSELVEEGDVRELCSALQNTRKSMKLNVMDKVTLVWTATDTETYDFMKKWSPEVEKQILASGSEYNDTALQGNNVSLSCGDLHFTLQKN